MAKIYARGEKPHHLFNQKTGAHAYNRYFYVKFGVITEIDYEKYEMKVMWLQQDGARMSVPISFPYAGPAGCMGMLPEIGSIGVFGFIDEGGGKGAPICLAFMPSGLATGIDQNVGKIHPDAIPTDDLNEIQHHFRPLRAGDMICASPKGSGLFLNNAVELYDGMGDMIMLRDGDQAILQTSINNHIFADGASVNMGPAVRNGIVLYDLQGSKNPNFSANSITMPDGKEMIYMVPGGKDISNNTQYYAEFRVDVDDLGDGRLDLNDVNGNALLSKRDPCVIMALGNFIGSDRRNETLYGRILKPVIFQSPDDKNGSFRLSIAGQNNGVDEPAKLGLAYSMYFPKSGSFLGVDKEGHYYINLMASRSNPVGAGRSMSILAAGNLKEIWGSDSKEANSWDLTTKGGIKWDVGKHSTVNSGRSIDISTDSGVNWNIGGDDETGYSKTENITGNVSETIGGNLETSVNNLTLTVRGLRTENVSGAASGTYQNDLSMNVMGVFSEMVIKEKQCKFGKRKTTITTGNDQTELLLGNIEETIKIGKKVTKVKSLGADFPDITTAIEQKVGAGTVKTEILAGKYKLEVTAGSILIKTKAGTVEVNGTTMNLKATAMVTVSSPLVKLANGALVGGVISGLPGKPTHFDYVTGAPHKGSSKVSVG